jgi:predicted RNase H-like HicB family nuclease
MIRAIRGRRAPKDSGIDRGGEALEMTTYAFKVVIEPDEDRWHAYCPALVEHGGATWGMSPAEALANLETVVKMVVTSLSEHGEPFAETAPSGSMEILAEPLLAVTV